MKMNDYTDIMLDCLLPDRKKLAEAIGKLTPGETARVRIDNSEAIKFMVKKYLENKWCRITDITDQGHWSIISIEKTI